MNSRSTIYLKMYKLTAYIIIQILIRATFMDKVLEACNKKLDGAYLFFKISFHLIWAEENEAHRILLISEKADKRKASKDELSFCSSLALLVSAVYVCTCQTFNVINFPGKRRMKIWWQLFIKLFSHRSLAKTCKLHLSWIERRAM